MKIQTSQQAFQNATGYDGNPRKRGPKLALVDAAFDNYVAEFDTARPARQLTLTADLFTACKDWLKEKSGKSDYKSGFLKVTKLNTNLVNRRNAIKALAEDCLDCMQALDPNLFARTRFDRHKIDMLSKGQYRNEVKTLAKGYDNERTSWLKSGKTQAIGGSGVGDALHGTKKKLESLSYSDYQKIFQAGNTGTVKYLKKAQRFDRMLTVEDDGTLAWAVTRQLADWGTQQPAGPQVIINGYFKLQRDLNMYAMDSYGNLITSAQEYGKLLSDDGFVHFNHSTFNAGREVSSAGMLLVQQGKLRWIDNNSGHYKPSKKNLYEAVSLLAADGADLSEAVIGIGVFQNGNLAGFDCFSAAQLLSSPLATPDLPAVR